MFYRILDASGRPHDIECDAAQLDEWLRELDGVLNIQAETKELFEKRKQQDKTGKADSFK